jgi:hypothetical protein
VGIILNLILPKSLNETEEDPDDNGQGEKTSA